MKVRGDAFEVFAEAYLSTDEMVQATEVWVTGKVPADIRRKLNPPSKDYGYDGVFWTKLGELVAYQVKFRSGRTPLNTIPSIQVNDRRVLVRSR